MATFVSGDSPCQPRLLCRQVATLKDQLSQEMHKRQQYISRSSRTGDEIRLLRSSLDDSLTAVLRDPTLDPMLLEHQTKKLDDTLEYHSRPTRQRSPLRAGSPLRYGALASTPAFRRSGRSPLGMRQKLKQ